MAAVATLSGCTKVDDTLGGNLVPDNQQMMTGYVSLPKIDGLNPKKYVETRLFQTDSIIGSNISSGYFGSEVNDTMGLRAAGFLSQYINYYKVDSGYFGYRPIFDSAQLILSITAYGADTTTLQEFAVYEVTSNSYLEDKSDTTFYLNFDPVKANILGDKLFTFTIGKNTVTGKQTGPATTAATLTPTAAGRDYIARLMLQKGKYAGDYSVYSRDSLEQFIAEFKGLYICPDKVVERDPAKKGSTGTIYATTLESTALSVYGRNHVKNDPSLIQDTIGMVYYFYDSQADLGNVSVNSIRHDYTQSNIRIEEAKESNSDRPTNTQVYVEGMGGVVTEMTFAKDFFKDLEAQIEAENLRSGKEFTTLAFSQVRMSLYFTESDYDWQKIDPLNPGKLLEEMNAAPSRLGMYTDYKKLTAISDYAYAYEKNYSTSLAYGGKINRSRGCYVMDVTSYVQQLWNSYLKEKERAGSFDKIDWSKVENRSVYLGPEAYSLYTTSFGVMQGMVSDEGAALPNNAPIRFDLTYNLIK